MPTWVRLELIARPFYDPRTGEILTSIEGRKNRPNIDPFDGGGKVYPDIDPAKILKRKEQGCELLLKLDMEPAEANALISEEKIKTYKATPKILKEYNANKDFKGEIVPDEIAEPIESGVTE